MAIIVAPNSDTLFDFEEIFETAALGVIEAAGIDALKARTEEDYSMFTVATAFTVGAADETRQLRVSSTPGAPVREEYATYRNCKLEIQLMFNRSQDPGSVQADATSKFGEVRSKLRNLFRESKWPFRDDNLKYYRVIRMRPDPTNNGTDQKNRDVCTLSYVIDFVIPQAAWPSED